MTQPLTTASDWDQRYGAAALIWSSGPNQFVEQEITGLRPGHALDLGAGEGRNALWLAEHGWRVTAVDFSRVGLDKARTIAASRGVTVDWVLADLFEYRPSAHTYDLVLVAYLQLPEPQLAQVLARAANALVPGGTMLVVGHDRTNLDDGVGGPRDPAVLHTPDEITAALPDLRVHKAGRVRRPVDTDGETRYAVDTLVLATAP